MLLFGKVSLSGYFASILDPGGFRIESIYSSIRIRFFVVMIRKMRTENYKKAINPILPKKIFRRYKSKLIFSEILHVPN